MAPLSLICHSRERRQKYLTARRIILFSLMFIIFTTDTVNAQKFEYESIKKHQLFLEFFPINQDENSGYGALNYEYRVGSKRKSLIRLGIYSNFNIYVAFQSLILA